MMTARWRRLRPRDVALFVVVAAVVAVVGVIVGRELGIGQQTGASVASSPADESPPLPQQQSEETTALTLSLSAIRQICETPAAERYGVSRQEPDESGRLVRQSVTIGWFTGPEVHVPVQWRVSGGAPPYIIVIDNETRDLDGDYAGPSGTAKVTCSDTSGGTFFEDRGSYYKVIRFHRVKPQTDSGWKTVRATVTDANGDTAEATTRFYVILDGPAYYPDLLKRGETYRIFGHLFTIPSEFDMQVGDRSTGSSGPGYQEFVVAGSNPYITILFRIDDFTEVSREVPSQRSDAALSSDGSTLQQYEIHAALGAFARSVDQYPDK